MRIEAGPYALRPLRAGDVPAIVAGLSDVEIARWLPNIPQPYTEADGHAFVTAASTWQRSGGEASFAIVDGRDELLGVAGVRPTDVPPSVGYWVAAAERGRGAASAATSALAQWAFLTFDCDRIELHAEAANSASIRVAERCGFTRAGRTVTDANGRELTVFERSRPT